MTEHRVPARQAGVRSHNVALVLWSVVRATGSRADVAARTGLTKAAVSSMVDELIERRLLVEDSPMSNGRGRPSKLLRLHPMAPVAIGVELNVDYVAAVRTDLAGRELATHRIELDDRRLARADLIRYLVVAWRAVRPVAPVTVLGTGVALPGIVGRDGTVWRAPNLPSLSGVNVANSVATALRIPKRSVIVDNEANLAALAELHAPDAERDFVYVSGEIGVGAGIVIGGELFRGAAGLAGELGHVSIAAEGRTCGCGGCGCVEQYAGQDALLAASGCPTVEALVEAVRAGRPAATRTLAHAGAALGTALAGMLNIVDVPTVVLGGVYARVFEAIGPAVEAELQRRVLAADARRPTVRASRTGADAAVQGAAASVVQRGLAVGSMLF